jgi:hypothetical protein
MSPENSKLYDEAYKELAKAKTVTISVAKIVNLAMNMARAEGYTEGLDYAERSLTRL